MFRRTAFAIIGLLACVGGGIVYVFESEVTPTWHKLETPSPIEEIAIVQGLLYAHAEDGQFYLCTVDASDRVTYIRNACRLDPLDIDVDTFEANRQEQPSIEPDCNKITSNRFIVQPELDTITSCLIQSTSRTLLLGVFVLDSSGQLWGSNAVHIGNGHLVSAFFRGGVMGIGMVIVLYSVLTVAWMFLRKIGS